MLLDRAHPAPMPTSGRSLPRSPALISSLTSCSFRPYLSEAQSFASGKLYHIGNDKRASRQVSRLTTSRLIGSSPGTHIGLWNLRIETWTHYCPDRDDLFIASNAASASSGRARTTKSSVRFTQRTFPDESIRNSAGREMSAPSRRPCTCTRSHLRITSSCASERIGNV